MPISWNKFRHPNVLGAATALIDKWKSHPEPDGTPAHAAIETRLAEVAQALQALEERETSHAEAITSMAEKAAELEAAAATHAAAADDMARRLQALEHADTARNDMLNGVAGQVQGLAATVAGISKKSSLAILLASGALLASVSALIVALMR